MNSLASLCFRIGNMLIDLGVWLELGDLPPEVELPRVDTSKSYHLLPPDCEPVEPRR